MWLVKGSGLFSSVLLSPRGWSPRMLISRITKKSDKFSDCLWLHAACQTCVVFRRWEILRGSCEIRQCIFRSRILKLMKNTNSLHYTRKTKFMYHSDGTKIKWVDRFGQVSANCWSWWYIEGNDTPDLRGFFVFICKIGCFENILLLFYTFNFLIVVFFLLALITKIYAVYFCVLNVVASKLVYPNIFVISFCN